MNFFMLFCIVSMIAAIAGLFELAHVMGGNYGIQTKTQIEKKYRLIKLLRILAAVAFIALLIELN